MNWADQVSALTRQLTEFFGITHPIRLGSGISLGFALHAALKIATGAYPDVVWIKTAAELSIIYFVATILGLLFVPLAFGGRGAPESAVNTIRIIRALMDAANYSAQKRNLVWQALIQKYVDAARPDMTGSPSAKTLFKEVQQESDHTAEI